MAALVSAKPRMAHCPGATRVEGTQQEVKQSELRANPPSHGSPRRDPRAEQPPPFIFCAVWLGEVMKISRKLTTVLSVGGPSCTVSVNVCRGVWHPRTCENRWDVVFRFTAPYIRHNSRLAHIPACSATVWQARRCEKKHRPERFKVVVWSTSEPIRAIKEFHL